MGRHREVPAKPAATTRGYRSRYQLRHLSVRATRSPSVFTGGTPLFAAHWDSA